MKFLLSIEYHLKRLVSLLSGKMEKLVVIDLIEVYKKSVVSYKETKTESFLIQRIIPPWEKENFMKGVIKIARRIAK